MFELKTRSYYLEVMKQIIMIICILCLSSCQNASHQKNVLKRLTANYENEMKSEYGLNILLNNALFDQKLKKFVIDFYHFEESEILQARFLIHRCAEELLNKINNSTHLQSCFEQFPLTEQNLEISISFIDPKSHKRHSNDQLSHVSLLNGRIYYSTYQTETQMLEQIHQEEFN